MGLPYRVGTYWGIRLLSEATDMPVGGLAWVRVSEESFPNDPILLNES